MNTLIVWPPAVAGAFMASRTSKPNLSVMFFSRMPLGVVALLADEPPVSREPPCPGSITTVPLAISFLLFNSPLGGGVRKCPACLFAQSFELSSGLFSCGLTAERITMNLFSRSNQNGAPSEIARAVKSQPSQCHWSCSHQPPRSPAQVQPVKFRLGSLLSSHPIGKPRARICC